VFGRLRLIVSYLYTFLHPLISYSSCSSTSSASSATNSSLSTPPIASSNPQERIMAIGNVYVIAAIAIIGGGLFGFDISSQSAILGTWQYKCYFNQGRAWTTHDECSGPTASVQGGISASMPGGSWVGALLSGFLSDMLGRRTSIMIGCIIW